METRRKRPISHVVGVDDFPFAREHRGDVPIVGTVFAGLRLDGILSSRVRRDGANAAARVAAMVGGSKFARHVQLVMLQGVALAGFNVVDAFELSDRVGVPILIVARRRPNMDAIREALLTRVPGGRRKWTIVERLGPMEPASGLWVQRVGLSLDDAGAVIEHFTIHGRLPEPIRLAHLIAGGVATGESRGRA